MKDSRVETTEPSTEQRDGSLPLSGLIHAGHQIDSLMVLYNRRRRVFGELPVAPPIEPRRLSERAVQEENDQRVTTLLKRRLGSIVTELERELRRFAKRAAVRSDPLRFLTWDLVDLQDEYDLNENLSLCAVSTVSSSQFHPSAKFCRRQYCKTLGQQRNKMDRLPAILWVRHF